MFHLKKALGVLHCVSWDLYTVTNIFVFLSAGEMKKDSQEPKWKKGVKITKEIDLKAIQCVMPGCGKTKENAPEMSFFSFPKDPDQ